MIPGPGEWAMPVELVVAAEREGRADWLATLTATVESLRARWSLTVGEPFQPGGHTAWVAPAWQSGAECVLKVAWRHPEAEHEAEGLHAWGGNGAVRLHAACEIDTATSALLLERCRPGTTLAALPEPDQDLVIAEVLHRLWIEPAAGHPFRSLAAMCAMWAEEFESKTAGLSSPVLDPGLARAGIALCRELPESAERSVLLCTDLHAGNILAATRAPWLVIDPKPYVGDPTYDAVQHMLNCDVRLHTDPRGLARRLAGLLDLDSERLLLWLFARCVQESPDWPELADVARKIAPR